MGKLDDETSEDGQITFKTDHSTPAKFEEKEDLRWLKLTTRWDTPYFSGYSFAAYDFLKFHLYVVIIRIAINFF